MSFCTRLQFTVYIYVRQCSGRPEFSHWSNHEKKFLKMVFDASLLKTLHYKVRDR